MKARLNLTIDEQLLFDIKTYANRKHTSISELVENYFKKVAHSSRQKNILDLVEKLEAPSIDNSVDLKELFYKDQAKKYGF